MKADCTKWKASLSIYGKISRYLHPECYFCNAMITHLVISKGTELHRFPLEALVYITAEGNYSEAFTLDGRKALISMQLGQIHLLMEQQLGNVRSNFIRLGRGLIINKEYIYHIDISKKLLIMSDCRNHFYQLSASREALLKLKEYMESTAAKEVESAVNKDAVPVIAEDTPQALQLKERE